VFGEGWVPVQKAGKWFYIDSGRIEMNGGTESDIFKYDEASRFTEGLAAVKSGEWGYINDKRWPQIPFRFKMAYPFHEGFAAVEQGNKWGYIDKTGAFIIRPQYEFADRFSEGLAPVVAVSPP
jgi:hypothetical protein